MPWGRRRGLQGEGTEQAGTVGCLRSTPKCIIHTASTSRKANEQRQQDSRCCCCCCGAAYQSTTARRHRRQGRIHPAPSGGCSAAPHCRHGTHIQRAGQLRLWLSSARWDSLPCLAAVIAQNPTPAQTAPHNPLTSAPPAAKGPTGGRPSPSTFCCCCAALLQQRHGIIAQHRVAQIEPQLWAAHLEPVEATPFLAPRLPALPTCLDQLLLRRIPPNVAGGASVQPLIGQDSAARVSCMLLQCLARPPAAAAAAVAAGHVGAGIYRQQ